MEQTLYLAHHGVKGMKWGVRHERKRAEKRARKAAYKRELAKPGSQSEKAVSTKRLKRGRTANLVASAVLGRELIADTFSLGTLAVSSANAIAMGYPAASVGALVLPYAIPIAAVGAAAGYGMNKTYNRYRSARESVKIREAKANK